VLHVPNPRSSSLAFLSPRKDFTDEEIRKLEEEWDKDEELEPEDLPPWKRPPPSKPAFDPNNFDINVRPIPAGSSAFAQWFARARVGSRC
jgi:hypothetical protein